LGWIAIIGYILIKRKTSQNGVSVAELVNGARSSVLNISPVTASTITMARPHIVVEQPVRTTPIESPFVGPISAVAPVTSVNNETIEALEIKTRELQTIVSADDLELIA
jgi:hypothetical protein